MTENKQPAVKFMEAMKKSLVKKSETIGSRLTPEWEASVVAMYEKFVSDELLVTWRDLRDILNYLTDHDKAVTVENVREAAIKEGMISHLTHESMNDKLKAKLKARKKHRRKEMETAPVFKAAREYRDSLAEYMEQRDFEYFMGLTIDETDELEWNLETMEAYVHFVEGGLLTKRNLAIILVRLTEQYVPMPVETIEAVARQRGWLMELANDAVEAVSNDPVASSEPSTDVDVEPEPVEEPVVEQPVPTEPAVEEPVVEEPETAVEPTLRPELLVEEATPIEEPVVVEPAELEARLRERLTQHMMKTAGVETAEELMNSVTGDRYQQHLKVFNGMIVPALKNINDPIQAGNIYIEEIVGCSDRQARKLRKELVEAGVFVQEGERKYATYYVNQQ